jgi:transposase-like protein
MRGDVHVRFGERPGETGRPKGRHRAPGRLDDHTALMGRVRDRIGDKRVLGLVKAFLRAGILGEDGARRTRSPGCPKGGSSHRCWPTWPSRRSTSTSSGSGRTAARYANKTEVVIAVELRHPKGLGRVRLAPIDSRYRKADIFAFAKTYIAPGTILYTDGDRLYNDLPSQHDITHERLVLISASEKAHRLLPAVHRVASLLKRWLAGTLHNGWSVDHLDYYLDEFTFRFNRRSSGRRGLLWYRLVQQAVTTRPAPTRS